MFLGLPLSECQEIMLLKRSTVPIYLVCCVFVRASVLRLASGSSTLPLHLSNSTALHTTWPLASLAMPIFAFRGDFIRVTRRTVPPHPTDDNAILRSLEILERSFAKTDKNGDPIILNQHIFEELVVDVRPLGAHPPISRILFTMVLTTIHIFFFGFGPVWSDSQIESGGEAVATFDILL